ncbi:MAG: ribonuclease P [Nanoarchaeota archaeon]|nr:ribonuclease P [Nanoarchaeota archaeon]MBU1005250.1 ribonuclease P [Nanoarchaeota archaeon]MBU1945538.1 ribonuclease P [Nanoarchaeota archaeon]
MRKKLAKKLKAKKEAIEIIPELLKKSKGSYKKGNKRLSKVQSKKIKYLSMKYKLKLPKDLKRQLCKNCGSILIPSVNCRVRLNKGRLISYCMECKKFTRMPLK